MLLCSFRGHQCTLRVEFPLRIELVLYVILKQFMPLWINELFTTRKKVLNDLKHHIFKCLRLFLLKDVTVKSFASISVKLGQQEVYVCIIHKNVLLFCEGIFKGILNDLDVLL